MRMHRPAAGPKNKHVTKGAHMGGNCTDNSCLGGAIAVTAGSLLTE